MPGSIVALVPARGGSKRVPRKNIRLLDGHPLLSYTLAAARESGVFSDVVVSTDDPVIAETSMRYGGSVPFLRPAEMAGDHARDIEWIAFTLRRLASEGDEYDAFSILRPTSPFRKAATIVRAWSQFGERYDVDSLRAVEKCSQHPGKMWRLDGNLMRPLLEGGSPTEPWHSTPYQALPTVYVQNASLEMAWTRVVYETGTIAGTRVLPFFTEGDEGFDINDEYDWWRAEELVRRGEATLPQVPQPLLTSS
jgi:N-acylneuraminate cytidylyltransferase